MLGTCWYQTQCLNSFLTESSDPVTLDWGMPQGSVIGPVMFVLYTGPLQDIIDSHDLSSMTYADDSQLYIMMKPSNRDSVLARLEACVRDIKTWMTHNRLMLNDSKTEVLHVTSRFTNKLHLNDINVGGSSVSTSPCVRDLGVIFDDTLKMTKHINVLCRNATFAIRKIGYLRRYLDQDSTEKLVHAFVTSRLDSCNAILYGLPERDLSKLQRIQNAAARVVTLTRKQEHISPIIRKLHWLPVKQRIIYKLMLLTFKSLHGSAPSYISELITLYEPTRSLRSASQCLLKEFQSNTKTYGDRRFAVCAPRLWNCLPLHIKNSNSINQFKSQLKTHLFNQAYN